MTFFQGFENVTSEEAGVQRQSKLPGDDQITKSSEPDSHSGDTLPETNSSHLKNGWVFSGDPFVLGISTYFSEALGRFLFREVQ